MIMKRLRLPLLLLCLALMAMFAFSACSGSSEEEATESQTKVLSNEEIVDIALKDTGIDPLMAEDIGILPDDGSGGRKVTFIIKDVEYSYVIDARTGEILDSVKPDTAPDIDPTEPALRMVEDLPEYEDASNIKAVQDGDKVIVTFDSGGASYKWVYDPADRSLTRK